MTRFWEVDFVRGIAICMMITYHILFDLTYFQVVFIDLYHPLVRLFLYPIGTTFLLLVGVSLTLSYARAQQYLSEREIPLKFVVRGLKIFGFGLLITLITYVYPHEGFIMFGILHCIGVCIMMSYPFLRWPRYNVELAVVFVVLGLLFQGIIVEFPWLLWAGIRPSLFYTLDYFPLLPWFGVVLLGMVLGRILYWGNTRRFELSEPVPNRVVGVFCFLGRHSLVIYLVHQPILIGIIFVFTILS